jgi:hypothetical protein
MLFYLRISFSSLNFEARTGSHGGHHVDAAGKIKVWRGKET